MKIALIYNFAQHYRANIFTLMDKDMDVDFYFGDHYLNVKKMDYSLLKHKVTEVRNIHFGPLIWQKNTIQLAWSDYDVFIMLGEPKCLTSWIILVLSRIYGKRLYFWSHGWYGREGLLKRIIKKIYFGLSDGVMLYGEYARQQMLKQGFSSDKLTVIHNSLAYDEEIEIRKTLTTSGFYDEHFGNSLPNLVFIGRLIATKKLDMIIRAMIPLRNMGIRVNMTYVGDGPSRATLEALVKECELQENVWFYGPCYEEKQIAQMIYNSDLCVSPGEVGLTAMHSMVYGTPVITHNNFCHQGPEFEAIKEDVTGAFFEYNNVEDLARVITHWLETHKNDREEVRRACFREIDENWNPHRQLEIIKRMIKV